MALVKEKEQYFNALFQRQAVTIKAFIKSTVIKQGVAEYRLTKTQAQLQLTDPDDVYVLVADCSQKKNIQHC